MSLKDKVRRLRASSAELDAERLNDRFVGLGMTCIADTPSRRPVRFVGEIKRVRVLPRSGVGSLEVVVGDGTGVAVVVFTGRRSLGGVDHGRSVVIEGVGRHEHGHFVVLNPSYRLLP